MIGFSTTSTIRIFSWNRASTLLKRLVLNRLVLVKSNCFSEIGSPRSKGKYDNNVPLDIEFKPLISIEEILSAADVIETNKRDSSKRNLFIKIKN